MVSNKFTLKTCFFPKQSDPFSIKETKDYGKEVGLAIQSEWFKTNGMGTTSRFYTERNEYLRRSLYASGTQPNGKYKNHFMVNGDLSYMNLDFTIISIIPKFVDIMVNGITQRDYSIKANSVDPVSNQKRIDYTKAIKQDMDSKEFLEEFQKVNGFNIASMPLEDLPASNDELEVHRRLNYKPSIELSEQLAIATVFNENEYDDIVRTRIAKDIVVKGIGVAKHDFSKAKGIEIKHVDPENFIYSNTKDPYFRDCFYYGEFETALISDIYVKYPNLTEEERKIVEDSSTSWAYYNSQTVKEENLKGKTNILYFNYKTTRTIAQKIKEKKNGGKVVSDAKENYIDDGKSSDFKRVEKEEEIWFEGVMVLGTDLILDWKVCANMVRPKSNMNKVLPNYVACAPNKEKDYIGSIVARMIPLDDRVQIINLKMQQIIQKMMPDGFFIDIDGLAEIDLGDGKAYDPTNAFNLLMQTGSVFGRSSTVGGEFNNGRVPITELNTNGGVNKLNALERQFMLTFDMMREVTGLNRSTDASTPDKDSLVGIQKLAALNSNIATRHILDAIIFVTKNIANCITYRIADVLKYSDMKDDLINKIGAAAVVDLEEVKNLHLFDFAIDLELSLDDEEKAKLEQDISIEIQAGTLGVEDKYAILNIKDLKLATSYMAILKNKRQEKLQKQKQAEMEWQTQQNIQSAQGAAQANVQAEELIIQGKMKLQEMINQGNIQKIQIQGQIDAQNMNLEYDRKVEIAQIEAQMNTFKLNEMEDRKDLRTSKQATQQSKLVEQRQKDGKPIDFEQEEYDLEAFKL